MIAANGFTKHVKKRINERTSLTKEQVEAVLNVGAYVNMGSIPGINKEHLLFYSTLDKEMFVLVRDSINKDLLTCLPISYHKNSAWKITEEHKLQAIALIPEVDKAIGNKPPLVYISVGYGDVVALLKYKVIDKFDHDYFSCPEAISMELDNLSVAQKAFTVGVLSTDIKKVTVRVGKRGLPKYFNFPFEDNSVAEYFNPIH